MNTTAARVCLDEIVSVMAEYDPAVRWNGFLAAPRFDAWTVETILAALADEDGSSIAHTWNDDGTLVLVETYGDEPDDVQRDEITPTDDGLYALGSYGWVWTEDPYEEYVDLVRAIGDGFHYDTRGTDYTTLPADYSPADVDRIVESAIDAGIDVGLVALDVLQPQ
jgi:hypothetical protein